MYTFLKKLKARSESLGNHVRKFTRGIDLYGEKLVQRLEKKGLINQVYLWKEAPNPAEEMEMILTTCDTGDEKLSFLGCYYGIQFLHMNFSALDSLFLNLTAGHNKFDIYRNMQFQIGLNFRRLNAAYMSSLLDIFLESARRPEFAICGVGTRADQDDLDVGIIDDASKNRENLNLAIGRINSEMMKWAVPLHFHLSQYVGEPGFTASIQEYNELLEREIHDFIIISEMLGAKLIMGSESLFHQFEEEITARYYYRKDRNNIYHEGYLRGILGEVRSLLMEQLRKGIICPKDDGMRMIRGLVYTEKTMFSIKSANTYEILAELKKLDKNNKSIYDDLESSLLFFETFRFLYQLLVIQDEEISLETTESINNIKIVAENMGFGSIGCIDSYERLLTHYFEYVKFAKEKTEQIFDLVTKHLQSISTFSRLEADAVLSDCNKRINIAEEFSNLIQFFRGTKFWDDVIKTLESNDAKFLVKLTSDLSALPPDRKELVLGRLTAISRNSFYGLLSLIMSIIKNINKIENKRLPQELNDSLFNAMKGTEDEIRRLSKVFSHYPQLINDYLSILTLQEQEQLQQLLNIEIWEEETNKLRKKLYRLTGLHCCTSQYFKRFFQKVVKKYSDYILYLDNTATLKHIAKGLLGEVDRHFEFKRKKEQLGDYYNIEFLRTGLDLLEGASFEFVNAEFTDFSDAYLQTLFDICKMEIDEITAKQTLTHDLLALYVTGGHARCHAFDDDYDIIVVLNSEDEQLLYYSSQILSRVNAEIIKRGVLPHFRFCEYTGFYVTKMSELAGILANYNDCTFIDKAQVLGARRVVGSTIFDTIFDLEIIQPYIFHNKDIFIRDMIFELKDRHQNGHELTRYNIKECLGGLRDVELFFLILKAYFQLREPITNDLVDKLCIVDPDHSLAYQRVKEVFDRLKHLRDVYRLTITADDNLDPEYLGFPAKVLGLYGNKEVSGKDRLLSNFNIWTEQADQIINETMQDLCLV